MTCQLRVRPLSAEHPVQPHCQPPRHHHFGHRTALLRRQPGVGAAQLLVAAHRRLSGLHQQKPHQRRSLLADVSQPLFVPRAVLARNQPQIAGHLAWRSQSGSPRPASAPSPAPSADPLPDASSAAAHLRALRPAAAPARPAPAICASSSTTVRSNSSRRRAACSIIGSWRSCSHPRRRPQLPALLQSLVQRQRLQLVLHLRPPPHPVMPVHQQLPHIALCLRSAARSAETALPASASESAPRRAGRSSACVARPPESWPHRPPTAHARTRLTAAGTTGTALPPPCPPAPARSASGKTPPPRSGCSSFFS